MKNLTKIFMAVCVALFALACTTDPTEDRGVNVDVNGQVSLTISLEGTKTHLGTEVDGTYPLYWSEGDAIAVNGHASVALTAEQAGEANATFTFDGVSDLGEVYNIVYPAPAADVAASATEGCYPVVFASAQQYDAEHPTLVNAPLYGYANAGEGATLKHLSGVLRIAPKGEGVTLTSLVVKAGKGAISGAFDVDCATGALTAREEASNTVTVTFGDGLALGAEATPIYVVVPAGDFGVVDVTLYTADDSMILSFDAGGDHKVEAGKVRIFPDIEYSANTSSDGVFYIDGTDAMIRFASKAAAFAPYVSAKVVADIDMTGVEWTPVEGFGAYEFDGGSDNGYSIKGLTAPLFGATNASLKNVKLVDVNINETVNPNVGAIARSVAATDTTEPVVTNCSASGKITVNCQEYEFVSGVSKSFKSFAVGGLIGWAEGVAFSECTNGVALDVQCIIKAGNEVKTSFAIAGIAAYAAEYTRSDSSILYSSLENCENTAAISIAENSYTGSYNLESAEETSPINLSVGGITGLSRVHAQRSLTNSGSITVSGQCADLFLGGIAGQSNCVEKDVQTNLINRGTILMEELQTLRVFVGGAAGCIHNGNVATSENHGAITAVNLSGRTLDIGGIMGKSKTSISNCQNSGVLNLNCHIPTRSVVHNSARDFSVGGVIGYASIDSDTGENDATISELKNLANGTISVTGSLCNANKSLGYFNVGGVVGTIGCNVEKLSNAANVTVDVNVPCITDNSNQATAGFAVGGVCGSCITTSNGSKENIVNSGNITIANGTYAGPVHLGGIVGYSLKRLSGVSTNYATNSGTITLCENSADKSVTLLHDLYVAGAVAETVSENAADVGNSGNIVINANTTVSGTSYIGGAYGAIHNLTARNENRGHLSIAGTYNGRIYVGGFAAKKFGSDDISKSHNYGNITFESGFTLGYLGTEIVNEKSVDITMPVGGIVGYIENTSTTQQTKAQTELTNSGKLTFAAGSTYNSAVKVGGVVGGRVNNVTFGGGSSTGIRNRGDIELGGTFNKQLMVGGIAAHLDQVILTSGNTHDAVNKGSITFKSSFASTSSNNTYVGGIAGLFESASSTGIYLKQTVNEGTIKVEKNANFSSGEVAIGGLVGNANGGRIITTANKGALTMAGTFSVRLSLGGIIGYNNGTTVLESNSIGATNDGIITVTSDAVSGETHIGGICGISKCKFSNKTINNGTIKVSGTHTAAKFQVGGGFGWYVNGAGTLDNLENHGNVTIKSDINVVSKNIYIGGGIGYTQDAVKNLTNSGNVTIEKGARLSDSDGMSIGGAIGQARATVNGATNTGDVTVYVDNLSDGTTNYISGVIASIKDGINIYTLKNYANVAGTSNWNIGMLLGMPRSDKRIINTGSFGGKLGLLDTISGAIEYNTYDNFDYIDVVYGDAISENDAKTDKLGWLQNNIDDTPIGVDGNPVATE